MADHELGEVLDFLSVLWATAHSLETRSLRMQRTIGVSWPQRLVLRLIGRFPNITSSALAEILCVTRGTLSLQLKRLEERGLLKRRTDTKDRRRAFLTLTAAGRALNIPAPSTVEAEVAQLLARSSASDIAKTKRVLNDLAKRLSAHDGDQPPPRAW
jgi:DNA-binding MarR family transcriptional regulator